MTNKDELIIAGLNAVETSVYRTLVEHGPQAIADVCRLAQVHRPQAYAALAVLAHEQLVSEEPHGKRKKYVAADPHHLRARAVRTQEAFESTLAGLEQAYSRQKSGTLPVRFFSGPAGLQEVLKDAMRTLKRGDTFYRISSHRPGMNLEPYVPEDYRRFRDTQRIEQFVIVNKGLKAAPHKKRVECLSKVLPDDQGRPFVYGVDLMVYGSKVAFIDFEHETATIIENPAVAAFQTHLFKALFDSV